MCGVARSAIRDDPTKLYYYEVEKLSRIDDMHMGLGGSYSNKFVILFLDKFIGQYWL